MSGMTSTGTLTLSDQAPFGRYASDGLFVLTLLAHDHSPLGTKTAWRLTWGGPLAAQFWQTHKDTLTPGTRLHVTAYRVWPFGSPSTGAELWGTVLALALPAEKAGFEQKQAVAGDFIACTH